MARIFEHPGCHHQYTTVVTSDPEYGPNRYLVLDRDAVNLYTEPAQNPHYQYGPWRIRSWHASQQHATMTADMLAYDGYNVADYLRRRYR